MSKTTTKAGADKAPATHEEALQVIQTLEASLKAEKEASAKLVADLNDLKAEGETLRVQAESNAKSLKADLAALKSKLDGAEALEAELEDAKDVIEELKAQLEQAGNGKEEKPLVTIGKETYKVMSGMVRKKKTYTAADIAADRVLAAELVAKGSTILKPLK